MAGTPSGGKGEGITGAFGGAAGENSGCGGVFHGQWIWKGFQKALRDDAGRIQEEYTEQGVRRVAGNGIPAIFYKNEIIYPMFLRYIKRRPDRSRRGRPQEERLDA